MIINDVWRFEDAVTGLGFQVIIGEKLDRLRIIQNDKNGGLPRDFWFTKKGKFDGTGSPIEK